MPTTDIEGNELKYGDRVTIAFIVTGVHKDGVALRPCDPAEMPYKQPIVTYESRLCQRTRAAEEEQE